MGHRLAAFLLSTLLALAPGLARATDFTGTWELDLEASQPLDELLKLRGVSWAQRRLARSLSVTLVIAQNAESLSLATLSGITSETVTIFPDDVPRSETTPKGDEVQVRHRWEDDGTLVTVTNLILDDGKPGTMTAVRSLDPHGRTMRNAITVTTADEHEVSATRVFRKR